MQDPRSSDSPAPPEGPESCADFHLGDYLGLSSRSEVLQAKRDAIRREGNAFLASSAFAGGSAAGEHHAFRELLARTCECEDAILAGSGGAAKVGLLQSIAREGTPIYLDQEAHASLRDGARLSRGRPILVRQGDPESLERSIRRDGAGIVCVDGYDPRSGAVADVAACVEICERTGSVLVLDETHSLLMTGECGGGLAVEAGVAERVHFRTASFSKAMGGQGGCILTSRHLAWLLSHRAHSVLFRSSALCGDSAAHRAALGIARAEPLLARTAREMASLLRRELSARGISTGRSACQIVPVEFEGAELACRFEQLLLDRGILASVLPPPAVEGTGTVRFLVHAGIRAEQVVAAAEAAAEAMDALGLRRSAGMRAA